MEQKIQEIQEIPKQMTGVYLTGLGGYDKLEYREDIPVPSPKEGEVLVKVEASAVNNTDINTRIGWYSKNNVQGTNAGGAQGFEEEVGDDGSWLGEAMTFPRIQGADCCGVIVAVGEGVPRERIGHVESGRVKPIIAKVYPLKEIVEAQKAFLSKKYTGKIVLKNT